MTKALITGITGFAGSHLCDHLLKLGGYEICGTLLDESTISNLSQKEKLHLHKLNLLDASATEKLIEEENPDVIFHLAALTSPRGSIDNPSETFVNNISAEINILEPLKKLDLTNTKVLIVSSAEIYGLVNSSDLPIDEETPFNPTNPYAVSKLSQDFLGLQYYLSNKIQTIRVRPFNHVGPRQSPAFVVSAFAKRIVEIEKGREKIMKVGNLKAKRDFTDVRDMVKAYVLAIEKGNVGDVYNLGSGKSYEISEILNMMTGMSSAKIETEEDESLLMPSDNPELVCDYSKFRNISSWQPEIPIEKTISDTIEYWRGII